MTAVGAYGRAFRQIGQPAFRRALLVSLGVALVVMLGLVWLGIAGAGSVAADQTEQGWVQALAQGLGGVLSLLGAWLAFPVLVTALMGLFMDDVVAAVEQADYPGDVPGQPVALWPGLVVGLRFAGLALGLNLLALPLYLVAAPLAPFGFYALNGYLLGREYFGQIGLRHGPPAEMQRALAAGRGKVFLTGLVGAFLLTVPLLNLIAPLLVAAAMVHIWKEIVRVHGPENGRAHMAHGQTGENLL
jgi:CysZ protein